MRYIHSNTQKPFFFLQQRSKTKRHKTTASNTESRVQIQQVSFILCTKIAVKKYHAGHVNCVVCGIVVSTFTLHAKIPRLKRDIKPDFGGGVCLILHFSTLHEYSECFIQHVSFSHSHTDVESAFYLTFTDIQKYFGMQTGAPGDQTTSYPINR